MERGGWGRERGLGTEGGEASFWREGEQTLPRPGSQPPAGEGPLAEQALFSPESLG